MSDTKFVLGVDLDGVVADFYTDIRPLVAEWLGKDEKSLSKEVTFGMKQWGIQEGEYDDLHRFAVSREFFKTIRPIDGAPATLRRLSKLPEVRIRIITARLYVKYLHQVTVQQTIAWLEYHGIPYWDLCFMKDKDMVGATVYIEDGPENIKTLHARQKKVIIFDNSTNRYLSGDRARSWIEVEGFVTNKYLDEWRRDKLGRTRMECPYELEDGRIILHDGRHCQIARALLGSQGASS